MTKKTVTTYLFIFSEPFGLDGVHTTLKVRRGIYFLLLQLCICQYLGVQSLSSLSSAAGKETTKT